MFGLQIVPQVTSIAVLWRCEGVRVGGWEEVISVTPMVRVNYTSITR